MGEISSRHSAAQQKPVGKKISMQN